ncbi:DoxX family protein [Antrihabitans stalactiti]|uniref:DoxX family protein n=1 Tax=Antrihabitans stalactiti TaxID=2584121 RepID=A0A848KNE2_9NOCA|nr:DoxX family protein [Antrihabitans stalactiti]NMN99406.1 DoxX family protein [Antrihabitans stalactiti]
MQLLRSDVGAGIDPGSPGSIVLGFYRIIVGFLFAMHGTSSLFGFPTAPRGDHTVAFLAWPSWWAAVIELVAGVFVMVGFGTRIAALLCSGSMAYAYLVVHQKNGLLPIENGGELAVSFCWAFFLLAFTGPGSFAVGRVFRRQRPSHT